MPTEHEIRAFSLMTPEGVERYAEISEITAHDLSLDFLTAHLTDVPAEQRTIRQQLLHMPIDKRIMAYRQEVYRDLRQHLALCTSLREIFDAMQFSAIDDSRTSCGSAGIWELIGRLRMLEQYCTAISSIRSLLEGNRFESDAMQRFSVYIGQIYEDSGFAALSRDIRVLGDDIMSIKSMTLGVNFNSEFAPAEVGLVSLNTYTFGEKRFLEKFMQFHRRRHPEDKELTPMTMLSHAGNGTASESLLMNNLQSLVEEMLPAVTGRLRRVLGRYTNISGTALARLGDELLFYIRFIELEQRLTAAGMPCSLAALSEDETHLTDFYNIKLALCQLDGTAPPPLVANDLDFTTEHSILLLTGPNQGGKTVFTQGIGLAFLLAQHGVFAPCSGGMLRICDGIYTHFPADENRTVSLGRLGEEAVRFREICAEVTADSLLLFNESFATTSHTESLYIAENALQYLCCLGARVCFNTHMHELAAHADALRTERAVCGAVSVVMGKRDGTDAYKIRYEAPDGISYAKDIAEQYGITFQQLCEEHLPNYN